MKLKCFGCGRREADRVAVEKKVNRVMPLCKECLDKYCRQLGSIGFWTLEQLLTSEDELERFFEAINLQLKSWEEKYNHLVGELTKLTKEAENR